MICALAAEGVSDCSAAAMLDDDKSVIINDRSGDPLGGWATEDQRELRNDLHEV